MCGVLLRQPPDLIDLLLDLQALEIVKLRLVALKCAVDIVLSLGERLGLALWGGKKGVCVKNMRGEAQSRGDATPAMTVMAWSVCNNTLPDSRNVSSVNPGRGWRATGGAGRCTQSRVTNGVFVCERRRGRLPPAPSER